MTSNPFGEVFIIDENKLNKHFHGEPRNILMPEGEYITTKEIKDAIKNAIRHPKRRVKQ